MLSEAADCLVPGLIYRTDMHRRGLEFDSIFLHRHSRFGTLKVLKTEQIPRKEMLIRFADARKAANGGNHSILAFG